MVILRFYNLISLISMECGITWSAHLFTCHCFHIYHLLLGMYRPRMQHGSWVEEAGHGHLRKSWVTSTWLMFMAVTLVSCAVSCAGKLLFCCCASRADLGEIVGERFEDLISGLGPGEGPGVLVPGADPRLDVVLQGFDGGVDTAADELVGQQAEPALDLVDPGRSGRGEVDVEARVPAKPRPDIGGVVRGVVVAHQVHVELAR